MITNILTYLEDTAKQYPDNIAFADACTEITFNMLEKKAKSIGSYISDIIGPGNPVVILGEKSVDCIIAFMGAVYAGCFYVLVDISQPFVRNRKIIESLKPEMVLWDSECRYSVDEYLKILPTIHPIKDAVATQIKSETLDFIRCQAIDTDALYTIFTSGSTGSPKGVVIAHRSVIDFMEVFCPLFKIDDSDVLANQAPLDFDLSVKDIYSALKTGARVELVSRSLFTFPIRLVSYLNERHVTTLIWAVSALLVLSVTDILSHLKPDRVNKVLFSGEVMPTKHLKYFQEHYPNALYVNLYGPTEITCNCMYYIVETDFPDDKPLPLGNPFPNERVLLLDENDKQISEADIPGEICVIGSCLALGYYDNPSQTHAAFCSNPLNSRWDETLYRTGDLAKYDETGALFFMGRKDFQVKHQGRRVELSEIESVLTGIEAVERVCCIHIESTDLLVTFYIGSISTVDILTTARKLLPQYMLPNLFRCIDEIPLTKNGKTDRVALLKRYTEEQRTGDK